MHLHGVRRHIIIVVKGRRYPRRVVRLPGQCVNIGKTTKRRSLAHCISGSAREGATGMASTAARPEDAAQDLAVMAGAEVVGTLIIPGLPEHVCEARSFIAKALGELHPHLDNAVLLTTELDTNAVMPSNSRCQGGVITVLITEAAGGVRIEVADEGSDLSTPIVRGDVYASDGHGLFLVQTLSDQWGYTRHGQGTTVWFLLRATGDRRV
jgi:anti-sigma regulatory factor (Ser/Thr protein kinase)